MNEIKLGHFMNGKCSRRETSDQDIGHFVKATSCHLISVTFVVKVKSENGKVRVLFVQDDGCVVAK